MKRILSVLIQYFYRRKCVKSAKLIGEGQKFNTHSKIRLLDSAKSDQIVINRNVDMYATINVANKGTVYLGEYSKIGVGSKILCVNKVYIGAYTAIANDVSIVDNNNHPVNPEYRKKMRLTPHGSDMRKWKHSISSPIIIGENVWIGTNVRICKGVSIGNNSVIAAASVVTKDVPENTIVAGNPAKIVKTNIDQVYDVIE